MDIAVGAEVKVLEKENNLWENSTFKATFKGTERAPGDAALSNCQLLSEENYESSLKT
jgi:hypothetical protein